MNEAQTKRQELIEAGTRMDARQLVAGTEGNLSARLSDGTILISSSGKFKGRLRPEDIVRIDPTGKIVEGEGRVSSEVEAHLTAYRLRDDIGAVVHAHPPHAVAVTMVGLSLEAVPIAEAAYAFGSVPTCPFAVPGTPEGGRAVSEWIGSRDALLLDRHGALTVGGDVFEALARIEMLEAVARAVLLAGGLDKLKRLDPDQIERIAEAALAAGARAGAVHAWRSQLLAGHHRK